MVETRSSSKSDSRVTGSTTKERKKTATNFTVKASKASRKTTKKATSTKLLCARKYSAEKGSYETPKKVNTDVGEASTQGPKKKKRRTEENARTYPKPNPVTEFDLVKEHYAWLCAKQYREANEGRRPKLKFLMEKQAEFLELDEKKQLEITEEYRAESKKNKNEEIDEEETDEEEIDEEADSQLRSGAVTELSLAQVYYAVQYCKKYMADNGGKRPPIEVLDAKQSEFRRLTDEEKEKILQEYLADKEKRKREEF